jgi:ribonuclease P protein component
MAIKTIRLPADQFRVRGYRTIATPFFLLKTKKNTGGRVRIGVVVGKAVHKSAVKRNFWKRQAREGLSALANEGSDILIVVSAGANRLTKKQFRDELSKAAAKAQ